MIASADNIESFSPAIFAAYCSRNALTCMERLLKYKHIIAPMRYEISQEAAIREAADEGGRILKFAQ